MTAERSSVDTHNQGENGSESALDGAVEHTRDPAARTPERVLSLVALHLGGLGAPRS